MKKNFKLSFKQLLLVGIVALTGLTPPASAYAMSNATKQIIQSEQPVKQSYKESTNFKLYINGKKQNVENKYLVVNGRTFLPVREVSTLLGVSDNNIGWDSDNRVASVSQGNILIEIPIDYTKASVNNQIKALDSGSSSVIANGNTYLPVNFLANNLGYQSKWYNDTRIIHLYNTPTEPELIQEASGNTSVDLHPFFKERGGVVPEGFVPKSGNYGDCVDLNGDGKIGTADVDEYSRSTERGQQYFMDGEFRNWYKSQHPAPTNKGNTTGQKSQDGNYEWDDLNQSWEFAPFGSDSFKSELREFKDAVDEMAVTSDAPIFG